MRRRSVFRVVVALLVPTAAILSACNPTPLRDDEAEPASEAAATTTTPAEAASPGTAAPPTTEAPPSTGAPEAAPQAVSAPTPEAVAVVPGEQFHATFDTPEDFYDRFQTETFFGEGNDRSHLAQWQGDHSHGCEGPTTQRTVHSDGAHDDEMFWWCAPKGPESGHIMTSMYTDGYAQVLFSPNQSFTDVTQVCWDQSMVGLPRKWTQVVVVPEEMYQANDGRLNYVNPELLPVPAFGGIPPGPLATDADGEPAWPGSRDAFNATYAPQWDAYLLAFTLGSLQQYSVGGAQYYFGGSETDDKAPRFRQCFEDLENGQIKHTNVLPDGTTREVTLPGALPDGDVRVIFEDDTYDSVKTELGNRSAGDNPLATWHWDNVSVT